MTMTGRLRPDGTGSVAGHNEGAPAGAETEWTCTATKIGPPIPEPPVPESMPAVPIIETAPGPAGVAVLLEVGPDERAVCLAGLKQLGLALYVYAYDHEQRLPAVDSWRESLAVYTPQGYLPCPTTGKQYIFNNALGGVDLKGIRDPSRTPVFWEPAIDAEGLVGPHEGQFGVCYADQHVQMVDKVPE